MMCGYHQFYKWGMSFSRDRIPHLVDDKSPNPQGYYGRTIIAG